MPNGLITTKCPSCQILLHVKSEFIGRNARCRNCQNVFVVTPFVPKTPPAALRQASPAPAPAAAPPGAPAEATPPLPVEGQVGLGTVFRWVGQGIARGLRYVIPLTLCVLILNIINFVGSLVCVLPAVFLGPPLGAGLNLALLAAARGERGILGRFFSGFTGGRYWPSMGIGWLLALIFMGASIPTGVLLIIVGLNSLALVLSKGIVGLIVLAILAPVVFAPFIFLLSRLMWAVPLVVDRRMGVTESLGASWRLTGRVAHGFGMFAMILVMQIVSLVGIALVAGTTLAASNVGMLGVLSALDPQMTRSMMAAIDAETVPHQARETPADYELRKARRLYEKLGKPLPPRQAGETTEAYAQRIRMEMNQTLNETMGDNPLATLGHVLSAFLVGLTVAGIVFVLLGSALFGVLAMPGMVGYRDLCPQAPSSGGPPPSGGG